MFYQLSSSQATESNTDMSHFSYGAFVSISGRSHVLLMLPSADKPDITVADSRKLSSHRPVELRLTSSATGAVKGYSVFQIVLETLTKIKS